MAKKFLSILLVLVLVLGLLPAASAAALSTSPTFSDMPDNWATEALESAVANGLLVGDDGKIMPDSPLTRAQMATIIARAFGATEEGDISEYTDVKSTDWFGGSMAKALKMGVMHGYDGRMNPKDNITREQAFAVLARAFKLAPATAINKTFEDLGDVSDWAKGEVYALVNAGYIQGSNGRINPQANISRAEFAQMIHNLIKQYIKAEGEYTEVADGNIMVNVPDATLKNVTINGDLIVGDGVGDGDLILDNVTLKGRLVARGGGANSIIIRGGSVEGKVIIAKVDGDIRVSVEGGADVKVIIIDDGKDDVIIEGTVGTVEVTAAEVPVVIQNATVEKIEVVASGATNITVANGAAVTNVVVNSGAVGTTLNIEGNVNTVETSAANTAVSGTGTVKNVTAKEGADNTTVTTPSTKINNEGASGVTAGSGKEVPEDGSTTNNSQGTDVITTPPSGGYPSYVAVSAININKSTTTLVEGTTETLTATFTPSNASNKTITWTTSDASKATIDSTGKVRAVSAGTATITAKSNNGKTATCVVTVTTTVVPVSAITVTGTGDVTTITTDKGTLQMKAEVGPSNASNKSVTWTVTETDGTATDKATISNTGLLTAVKNGTVKVTATAKDGSGKSGFANITITNQMIEKTAAEVAALITTITAPAKDATSLTLPTVEAGYTVAIKSSDKTGVIALSGTITPPATEETVALVLEVTRTSDSTKADTVSINVVVPAKTVTPKTAAEVAALITTITAPAKDATSLTLPTVEAGYTVAIKSSDKTGVIALSGTITPPATEETVALVLEVTRTSDSTKADTVSINVVVPAKTVTPKTAAEVAALITTITAPAKDATSLTLPTVEAGYTVAIKSSDKLGVIALDGTIVPPATEETVALVLEVTRTSDSTKADTVSINVVVPAKTVTPKTAAEVAALITTITAPAKDATSLTLPTVEAGYTVAIKSSDKTGVIALSGTITPPATEETVALVLEVTRTSDSTKADTVSINVVVPAKTVTPKTAAEVAALITTITAPAKDATSLTLPTVEAGYTVAIKSSDKLGVIALDGTIVPPATEETVALVLEVTRTSDSTKADTVSINVVVPAKTVVLGAPVTGLDEVLQMGKTITATASTTEPGASTWTSSDTSVATVDESTGFVTALKAGTTTIAYTASTSGNLNSKEITVYAATFTSQTDNSISNDVATLGLVGNEVSSSSSSVAKGEIESDKIKITSIAQGSTTITVKSALNYEAKIAVTVAVDGTITIGAITKPALNVTYNKNGDGVGGTVPTQAPLTSGDTFTVASPTGLTAPTDMQFKEWNTNQYGSGTGYAPGSTFTMETSNVTLFAIWENIYTVTFVAGANGTLTGATKFADIMHETAWETAVTVPSPVADSGFKFKDWTPTFPAKVTKNETYTANFVALSINATLSDLKVDGTTITGLNASILTYNVELPAGTTTVPTVTATATDSKANAVVTAAASLPGSTTVLVTAEDGTTTKTYTIDFILNQAAPTGLAGVAPTTVANNDGKITGTTTEMEWRAGSTGEFKAVTGIEITGLATGTYEVRYAAKTGYKAGATAEVTVAAALGGTVSIDGTLKFGEELTANVESLTGNSDTSTLTYTWKRESETIGANQATYTTVEADIGKTITVEITSSVETGTIIGTASSTIEKADGPPAPAVVGNGTDENKIVVTHAESKFTVRVGASKTDSYEYSIDGGTSWTNLPKGATTSSATTSIKIRVQATEISKAGEATEVVANADFVFNNTTNTIMRYIGSATSIDIPVQIGEVDVKVIGEEAFRSKGLTSVNILASLTNIEREAFNNNQLTSIIIPASVTTIGNSAFRSNKLISIEFKGEVASIVTNAFNQNGAEGNVTGDSLVSPYKGIWEIKENKWIKDNGTDFAFNEGTGTITGYTGTDKVITIPEMINGVTVKSIGSYSLSNKSLTSVSIPDTVTSIGDRSFNDNNLTSLTIGSSVTSIGNYAFAYNELVSITIPASVTSIGYQAFQNNKLTDLDIPNSVTSIGYAAFNNNQLEDAKAFIYARISDGAEDKAKLISYGGAKKAGVVIPASVTEIGEFAFSRCQISSVTIPETVTSIGGFAFEHNKLTEITISSSVTSIEKGAFNNNELPDDKAFIYARKSDGTEDKAKLVSYGGSKKEGVVIPSGIQEIGESAFSLSKLESVTIPNTVTIIRDNAFYYTDLTSIIIPEGVTTLGSGSFRNNKLISVTIPATVTTIGGNVFQGNGPGRNNNNFPSTDYVGTWKLVDGSTTWTKE